MQFVELPHRLNVICDTLVTKHNGSVSYYECLIKCKEFNKVGGLNIQLYRVTFHKII